MIGKGILLGLVLLGLGDIYSTDTYTLQSGTYILTESDSQDWATDVDPLSDSHAKYIHVVRKRINGRMTTTTVEYLTTDEVGSDFDPDYTPKK